MPATQESPSERRRLYAELWISFTALIRSYVAAHDLARPTSDHARVVEGESGRLVVATRQKMLLLDIDTASGAGVWGVQELDSADGASLNRGRFEIGSDSRVAMSDRAEKLDLEVAAEAFTAKVFDQEF